MVKGFNNWDRIRQYRRQWEEENREHCSDRDWQVEFQRIIPHQELYRDTFVILSQGEYSGVPGNELALRPDVWRRMSLIIRREHEATHYFTLQAFGSARNHAYDELLADYAGITAALGRYEADWFLRFMGLENYPQYRAGGRLQNYLGNPPLSSGAFTILQQLVKCAADNIAQLDKQYSTELEVNERITKVLCRLVRFTLIDLAIGSRLLQN